MYIFNAVPIRYVIEFSKHSTAERWPLYSSWKMASLMTEVTESFHDADESQSHHPFLYLSSSQSDLKCLGDHVGFRVNVNIHIYKV